jgi:hypothetical protein
MSMTTHNLIQGSPLDMERIRQRLSYEPETGEFTWLCNLKGSAARVGARAGCKRSDGYCSVVIDGRRIYSHRLAWMFEVGEIPDGMEIDHIDHNPSNNRISNLRLVTKTGNRKNRSRDSRNKSGVNGVHWAPHANAWSAQIRSNRKTTHIGYFKNLDEAKTARLSAEAELGFHQNHGAKK